VCRPVTHLLALLAVTTPSAAQAPSTDVYLAPLERSGESLRIGQPLNITRRSGYDNQPHFTRDGSAILYTAIGADGQADTYRYDIAARVITRVTSTSPESEYSPVPLSTGGFAVVRVEADSTQRLWRFDHTGGSPHLVLEHVRPVGYHAWADDTTVAMFVLGSPATLQLAGTRGGQARTIAEGIGRSLQKVPGRRAISFVRRTDGGFRVEELDVETAQVQPLISAVTGGEFHAWTPAGALIMASGSRLFSWKRGDAAWTEIADLAPAGVRTITRIAISPAGDYVAFVAAEPEG
jgi:hypothetical protein